jgi:circadian clock protein KaiC
MQLSFKPFGGERNRALTIIKSRGMKHSNQVRELVIDEEGLTLTDVCAAGGDVLILLCRKRAEDQGRAERQTIGRGTGASISLHRRRRQPV